MEPKFNNRENEEIKLPDGRTIWLSRSPAVVAVILGLYKNDIYALIQKRSKTMRDEPGKWVCVSGYLDWDENGYDGIIREVYEETSFYIPDHKNQCIFHNQYQPFYVHSDPNTDAYQNVSLTYIFIYRFRDGLPKEIEKYQNVEIDTIKWENINNLEKYDWAFYHDERIKMAIEKYEILMK